ncbi:unnamed protein product [Prorocentrum cordatum]|uniref:Uncharacterized protein n=1 Tax=Prorocentrum cordatum TaxID=2364126 RepID=A0ABN9X2T7_9DINO|nr:unnamed protein product [Polarella glacialis]
MLHFGRSRLAKHDPEFANRRAVPLPSGRPIRAATRRSREKLLIEFDQWLLEIAGYPCLASLLEQTMGDPRIINGVLVEFGQYLWREEAPYSRFADTVNAVASRAPELRKLLGAAWDLGYQWIALEPGNHHIAMPLVVLKALTGLCLLWGWPRIAVLLAAGFAGIMRPSEFLLAKRAQLALPRDILFERPYALFTIQLPKTATLGAKIQSARVEPPDIVEMLDCIFGAAPPEALLWPMSGQTFRKRFNSLCRELRLPLNLGGKCRGALDLASLRAGGATQLFLETDDPHLVQNRGRWMSQKVMLIYLQELVSTTYMSELPVATRTGIFQMGSQVSWMWPQAVTWVRDGIPASSWPSLWCSMRPPS